MKKQDDKLAQLFKSMHIEKSPISHLPNYSDGPLKKGVICSKCHSFSMAIEGRKCICVECKIEESVENAVLRTVEEYKLLFPTIKITSKVIQEWCAIIDSKQRIQRILEKHYKKIYKSKWTYYE